MLHDAAREFNVDLSRSYLIGDSFRDLQAARNAGMKAVLVLTGYGKETQKLLINSDTTVRAHFVASDLLAAAYWVVQDVAKSQEF
jgi:histidinol phosphatase-like enzyme